ncbi:DNA helicase [Malassezia sp. CBS 17886]|nr:DNA helicase [Malassezia sp. CBS 17886]
MGAVAAAEAEKVKEVIPDTDEEVPRTNDATQEDEAIAAVTITTVANTTITNTTVSAPPLVPEEKGAQSAQKAQARRASTAGDMWITGHRHTPHASKRVRTGEAALRAQIPSATRSASPAPVSAPPPVSVPPPGPAPSPLRAFLESSMLATDVVSDENRPMVTISTCHAAKGLEWPVVFVPAVEDGVFPFYRCKTPDAQREERRLLYVAMTRAETNLYLTCTTARTVAGERQERHMSTFVAPLVPRTHRGTRSSSAPPRCIVDWSLGLPPLTHDGMATLAGILRRTAPGVEDVRRAEASFRSGAALRELFELVSAGGDSGGPRHGRDASLSRAALGAWGMKSAELRSAAGPAAAFQPRLSQASVLGTAETDAAHRAHGVHAQCTASSSLGMAGAPPSFVPSSELGAASWQSVAAVLSSAKRRGAGDGGDGGGAGKSLGLGRPTGSLDAAGGRPRTLGLTRRPPQ